MINGIPADICWLIEAKVRLAGEFSNPFVSYMPGFGKTEHNGAGQHDKCSHVSNRCHPSPRTECHLATYPSLAHQLRRVLGASQIWRRKENECDEDDDWEYVEEWPAEIIWQGNEIIMRKKKVRVPKKDANPLSKKEDVDRPTSNPLPPQSETFADHQNAQQALETVAQQVPNFGTEQACLFFQSDKAHCPFHLKTGACRFGQRCSRVHFYPNKACTLLIKNMYNGPGLAWEQDEGLEIARENRLAGLPKCSSKSEFRIDRTGNPVWSNKRSLRIRLSGFANR
ncbi:hypothetical protein KPL70_003445 [Citrus sinensis]|nr:hypothetical protein KPL70_003445 [Citrus sinensis]